MGEKSYVVAPAAGYTLLALFVDVETATQASDMVLVQAPVVAFSMEDGGLARPVPVRSLDVLDEGEAEFKTIALQLPDSTVIPFTRGWFYKDVRLASVEVKSIKTLATLAAWRAASWALLQAQLPKLTARVAAERQRNAEDIGYTASIAAGQDRIRQANERVLSIRRDEINDRAARVAARNAEIAALLAAAGKP